MSEKVRLTKEQAKAVEVFKDNNLTLKDYAYENLSEELDPIQILGIDKMARALYVGYEIEPELDVGDWVISKVTGEIGKITRLKSNGYVVTDIKLVDYKDDVFLVGKPDWFLKKTPEEIAKEKQRRWWEEHSRGVWELKKGDILISKNTNRIYEYKCKWNDAPIHEVVGENEVSNMDSEYLKKNLKVVCFARDRKDLDD